MKKISVITPVYNDGDTLELHIETFLDQDYPERELILIDDGSKDNTRAIMSKYAKKYPKFIKAIYFPKNRGACVARNWGAKEATGDVYSFLPADSFLPPGLLRKWMNLLEKNPEYGFVYGGYSFVDSDIKKPTWMGGRMVQPYFSAPFDPIELETGNYIDGSFPIRKEIYWQAAEKMGLKDGLWNPAVKSLQDWDFWLSVVKGLGVKGLFFSGSHFETTLPHAGGLSFDSNDNWLARLRQIKSIHKIKERKLCVTSLFAEFHGRSVAKLLDADYLDFPPLKQHDYDAIYLIGFWPNALTENQMLFMNPRYLPKMNALRAQGKWDGTIEFSRAKKFVHFIGSDVMTLSKISLEELNRVKAFLKTCDGVFCEIDQIQKELKSFGIEADIVPFPPKKWIDVSPLPEEKSVAVYMPKANEQLYLKGQYFGMDGKKNGIVHMMPDVKFHFFGNPDELRYSAKNVIMHGRVDGPADLISKTRAIIRTTVHDGLPISVAEWIGAGRNALTTIKMPHADYFDLIGFAKQYPGENGVVMMQKAIVKRIYEVLEKPLNEDGAKYYRKTLDVNKYRKAIAKYMEYDERRYWDRRAESWVLQSDVDEVKEKKLKNILSTIKFDSVLDVGCGSGRFVNYFKDKKYTGCDIAKHLVDVCKERFPERDFYTSSVEDVKPLSNHKFDLVFCYTVLEHVPPENIQKAVDALKSVGKKMLIVEPVDFIPQGDYCYSHDYKKLFNVTKTWKLGDKVAHLVEWFPLSSQPKIGPLR